MWALRSDHGGRSTVTDDEYAVRRLRCYEFAHVVPWTKLVEDMEEQR
jgi:hypothetical protein